MNPKRVHYIKFQKLTRTNRLERRIKRHTTLRAFDTRRTVIECTSKADGIHGKAMLQASKGTLYWRLRDRYD